jgi:peptidyl-prolyl cis-trans isomerase D
MSDFIKNKTSGTFATILIGIIVLSFMFTGYQTFSNGGGSANAVAKVGNQIISPEEYQQEINRQMEVFKQMFGGELSQKQIESMHLKESALKNIVQRKLMLKLASDVGYYPSNEAIKNEIKKLPYFLTDGQFDINRYKALLAANNLTPQAFEQKAADQLKMSGFQGELSNFPISYGYIEDLQKFKSDKLDLDLITIQKDNLRKHIDISKSELDKYLSNEINKKRVAALFKEREPSLSKPEEVTARHILLSINGKDEAKVKSEIEKIAKEVTSSNFTKLADKYTEDPSGKGKGGSLGAFSKGKMVPEFDQVAFTQKVGTISAPVKTQFGYHLIFVEKHTNEVKAQLAEHESKIATELIQKEKIEELKKLTLALTNDLKKALESNNEKEVKALTSKYTLEVKKADVNRVDGISTGANLTQENMKEIFSGDLQKSKVILFDDGNTINLIKTYAKKELALNTTPEKLKAEASGLKNVLSRKMIEGILKKMETETKVKVFSNNYAPSVED